jgi:hypothetical protein
MFVIFLPVCSVGSEVRHVDRGQVPTWPTGKLAEEVSLEASFKGTEEKIDRDQTGDNEHHLSNGHVLTNVPRVDSLFS